MNYKALLAALRSIESRSKRELLDKAIETIEALVDDLYNSDCRESCDFCVHGHEPAPCEGSDFVCDNCECDCICKDCRDNSKWEWRGVQNG